MDEDDLVPRAAKPKPKNLEGMSLESLREYIVELEAEIARTRDVIADKEAAQATADTFFRK